jgi:hypothetical protein
VGAFQPDPAQVSVQGGAVLAAERVLQRIEVDPGRGGDLRAGDRLVGVGLDELGGGA